MQAKSRTRRNLAFVLAFLVLTLFCWCPLGYGSYGQVPRVLGIPSWAVLALGLSAVLFVVEWIYLFHSQLAMNDDELPDMIAQLQSVDTAKPLPVKEDE
ncbi:MAG: DUF997 domain-containing protein [Planctomycetes bacterium]|nr:DUF997 domain-containing protein [Planctomycetota bacterium]